MTGRRRPWHRRPSVTGPVATADTRHEIVRLAVPAFLALVAEPLFLLADAAIVGHLGTPQLAGLGIASSVLGTLVSLCIFLAYGTTASVARRVGAGDTEGALAQGVDGLWLAALIGVVVTVAVLPATRTVVGWFGPSADVASYATTYLHVALLGAAPLLLMLAATGVLRGLQDTRTPLVVAVVGNVANVVLNLALVYGVGLGIAGSALGTLVAQLGSALALVWVVVRAARASGAPLAPDLPGIRAAARAGVPLLLRTLTLRVSLLVMTYGAARLGSADLAAMQLAMTIWTFLAFVLDAIAIAAQAITGRSLGAGDVPGTRAVTDQMVRYGLVSGFVTGLLLAASAWALGPLFTTDPVVHDLLVPVLLVAALAQPVAGVVFVLDGVLIGAGDGRYLAWARARRAHRLRAGRLGRGRRPGHADLALGGVRCRVHGRPRGRARGALARNGVAARRRDLRLTRVTPLQKIAMGLVIVLVPANFPRDPHPEWRFYDALPDPLGWLLVLAGVWALSRASDLDLDVVRWLGVVAFVVSVPLWFPQVSHLLVPEYNPDITVSFQWFAGAAADAVQPVPGAHGRPGRASTSSPATSSWRAGSVSSPGGWPRCWCCPSSRTAVAWTRWSPRRCC